MDFTIIKIFSVFTIAYGIVILTRKKIILKRMYESIFIFLLLMSKPLIDLSSQGHSLQYFFIVILPLALLYYLIIKDRYILININYEMALEALTGILRDLDISYEENKNTLLLIDHMGKKISFNQSLNTVDINFKEISDLSFYKSIKSQLKIRINKLEEKVFPYAGILYISLGVIMLILYQYLESRIG